MIDKVKELAVQAGVAFRLSSFPSDVLDDGTHVYDEEYVFDNFNLERFSELLINECAKVVVLDIDDPVDFSQNPHMDMQGAFNAGKISSSNLIQTHFKIEDTKF